MPAKKFNGKINGKSVKVISSENNYKKQWFAKPKEFDIDTPLPRAPCG